MRTGCSLNMPVYDLYFSEAQYNNAINQLLATFQSENRVSQLQHEVHDLRSKSEEDMEDTAEIMNKYKSVVKQLSDEKDLLVELQGQVEELKREKSLAEDKVYFLHYFEGWQFLTAFLARMQYASTGCAMCILYITCIISSRYLVRILWLTIS